MCFFFFRCYSWFTCSTVGVFKTQFCALSWTKTKLIPTPIMAFSSGPSVETVAAFAVLGFQLGAPPIILHPRPPTETSQKLDFFKNKTVFLPPLSPIFPNILSSCKWAVHRGRVIGNIPLDIWRYL